MNPSPYLHGREITNPGCGRAAVANFERYWWQSRHGLRDAPELVDIRSLAREIRTTYPRTTP